MADQLISLTPDQLQHIFTQVSQMVSHKNSPVSWKCKYYFNSKDLDLYQIMYQQKGVSSAQSYLCKILTSSSHSVFDWIYDLFPNPEDPETPIRIYPNQNRPFLVQMSPDQPAKRMSDDDFGILCYHIVSNSALRAQDQLIRPTLESNYLDDDLEKMERRNNQLFSNPLMMNNLYQLIMDYKRKARIPNQRHLNLLKKHFVKLF